MSFVKKILYKKKDLLEPHDEVFNLDISRKEYFKITKHISKYIHLKCLDISHNNLSEIPISLSRCAELTTINCSYNTIYSLDLNNFCGLETLDCSHNKVCNICIDRCSMLENINVQYNMLHEIVLPAKSFKSVFLEYNCLTKIPNVPQECYSVSLSCNKIQTLQTTFASFENLKNLYVYKNKLVEFNLGHSIPISIELIDASYNYISEAILLQAEKYTNLKTLHLCNNKLEKFELHHSYITEIDVSYNQLATLDFTRCTSLAKCICKMNVITSIALPEQTITILDASYNHMTSVPQLFQPNLKMLNLENNHISAIRKHCLRSCTMLEHLNLSKNNIERVSKYLPEQTPRIKLLNLSNNPIYELPANVMHKDAKVILFNCPIATNE